MNTPEKQEYCKCGAKWGQTLARGIPHNEGCDWMGNWGKRDGKSSTKAPESAGKIEGGKGGEDFSIPPALLPFLALAVEVQISEWREQGQTFEALAANADEWGMRCAELGAELQFPVKASKWGPGTRGAFVAYAKALALASLNPGGVDYLGAHFENTLNPKGATP